MQNEITAPLQVFRFLNQTWHFPCQRPLIMGVLNLTPDSFSDGGQFIDFKKAMQQAKTMIDEGADILDIGGESTRPGALEVPVEEEKKRVLPIIHALVNETSLPISVDTRKARVAEAAIQAGAGIINDVSGLNYDPAMIEVLRDSKAGAVIMHMRGTPQTMQQLTDYQDVVGEIHDYFQHTLDQAVSKGVEVERLILDPGIGFSKTIEHNLQILARLPAFRDLGRPLLVGPSRKSFIGKILGHDTPTERKWGTAAAIAVAAFLGADLIRVHDVRAMREVATIAAAIK